jgi:UDPglucose 6-dehydrogenase
MRIAVVGAGYVGLVTGTCFAESGNEVTIMDVDAGKIDRLKSGRIPIYEPGLAELVESNSRDGRLHVTTSLAEAAAKARLVFLAVGTPSADDGSADLTSLWKVIDDLAPHLAPKCVVVIKSTVPVGTNALAAKRLRDRTQRECDVASNPEFLKEGAALDDFTRPDRVVVGVRRPEVATILRQLYAPFLRTEKPFLVMSPESAEMTKYVANAMLATKISFINEMANLCEHLGADVNDVRRGIGHDSRIGFSFLFPGVGYGGSCFPKDVRAIQAMARACGLDPRLLAAADAVNEHQKSVIGEKVRRHFEGNLAGRTIAVWGLAFKPRTDDIREAPALTLIDALLADGAQVRVHDPEAMSNVRRLYGDKLVCAPSKYDALDDADALCIMTEWKQFVHADFDEMRRRMRHPVVFDGRNIYEPDFMRASGFTYISIGRP